jgi:acetate---CoA ligase (ADP-forming)
VGGVRLNLASSVQVRKAAEKMLAVVRQKSPGARIQGVMVQRMAPRGREVILGFKRDAQFGPLLMFGLGGSYVEVAKDVTFRVAPIRELGAERMIHSIHSYPILQGVRGEKPADLERLKECLERLSQMAVECPDISELDVNPLIVYNQGQGCLVADIRVLLKKP